MTEPTAPADNDAHARIHNIDQRSPQVTFEHPALAEPVVLHQRGASSGNFVASTSSVVWAAAPLFARYLCEQRELVRDRKVVELGAGIGLVGAVAAALGGKVVLTECEVGMPLLEVNAQLLAERGFSVSAACLDWGNKDHEAKLDDGSAGFDLILASDVILPGFDTDLLIKSAAALLRRSPDAAFFLAFEFREDWETIGLFLESASDLGLSSTFEELDEDGDILFYTFRWSSCQAP